MADLDPDRVWAATNTFQRDLLATIPAVDALATGPTVRESVGDLYCEDISRSRFYTALGTLRDRDLVDEIPYDGRAKCFSLTDRGETTLTNYADWLRAQTDGPAPPATELAADGTRPDCWIEFPIQMRDLLAIIGTVHHPPTGAQYVDRLNSIYDNPSTATIYRHLKDLADKELIVVENHTRRANTYRLTQAGATVRADYAEWVEQRAAAV